MTSIIEKRVSLHRQLAIQKQEARNLESEINMLQGPANIGITACMIAHEVNNLLMPLSNYAKLALRNPEDKALTKKALLRIEQNSQHIIQNMESMQTIANGHRQEKKNVVLTALLDEVFNCLCRDFKKDGINLNIQVPEDLTVCVVPVQMQQVFMNLILNARDAMITNGGILSIKARTKTDCVQIEVKDTGTGIAPEQINTIFEPFFTTKEQQRTNETSSGFGFGLAFCKRIVDEHKGRISVDSTSEEGTTFTITLNKP